MRLIIVLIAVITSRRNSCMYFVADTHTDLHFNTHADAFTHRDADAFT